MVYYSILGNAITFTADNNIELTILIKKTLIKI